MLWKEFDLGLYPYLELVHRVLRDALPADPDPIQTEPHASFCGSRHDYQVTQLAT